MSKAMNATIILVLSVFFPNCLKTESSSHQSLIYQFVGFIDGNPAFAEISSNTIVALNHAYQKELIMKNAMDESIVYFGDCGIGTYSKEKRRILFQLNHNRQIAIPSYNDVVSMAVNESCNDFAYATYDSTIVFNETGRKFSILGAFPHLTDRYVFLTRGSDEGAGYVTLYRVGLRGEDVTMMLDGIFEDGILVLEDGRFIACQMPINGIPKKVIYSVSQGKFCILNDSEIQQGNYYPMYHPKRGFLFYYTPENLRVKSVEFPKRFDFARN